MTGSLIVDDGGHERERRPLDPLGRDDQNRRRVDPLCRFGDDASQVMRRRGIHHEGRPAKCVFLTVRRAQRLAGGKWTKIDWRDVQGAPAADSVGPIAGGSVLRQLVLLKGRRTVSLAYLAPADALRTPEAERFFQSVRLVA